MPIANTATDPSHTEDLTARFNAASRKLTNYVSQIATDIATRPRYNDKLGEYRRLVTLMEQAGEVARQLAERDTIHPASKWLKPSPGLPPGST